MLLSDNFSMNTKFVDLTELYKLGFHKKIVTQKHLGDQGVCHTKIEKFYRRTHFRPTKEENILPALVYLYLHMYVTFG